MSDPSFHLRSPRLVVALAVWGVTAAFVLASYPTLAAGWSGDGTRATNPALSPGALAPPLSLQLQLSPNPVAVGNSFSVDLLVSGGSPPYSFTWTSIPPSCSPPGNVSSWSCSASSTGTYTVGVTVRDTAALTQSTSASLTVTSNSGHGSGGGSNSSGFSGFNLSGLGSLLIYGLIGAIVVFALLVALTIGVLIIAGTLVRRLPRPPKGGRACPACHAAAPATAKFCPDCGHSLAEPPKTG